MAENIVTPSIPPGAVAIIRSTNVATTLYTAVTRRRLHITSLTISTNGGAASGICSITITPENGVAADFNVIGSGAANQANSASANGIDIPTVTNVTTSLGTFTGTVVFTLIGWEESTPS